ncbi:RIO1-domain-containing protein [Annulohypoxylon maeteangense]|uniref:RIO1-domain-containing protein n=1 Tax=Annulohypoxylon maeteangense TaxID=1927788 RepID=UPI002008DAFC|nr:RIO1-domain-containing protein [Annulohypoxylon maeteangense]KAI0888999.1 RIO1-domain-containing protein [Annulohypoxylon maeteangense]
MKLDTKAMRHLTAEDWRVLTACEIGSRNHELIPTPLIESLSKLRGGASRVHKSISALAKVGLIARVKEAKYDGYRLTYGGVDYLALHTYASRKEVYSVGNRIGVGKESDILVVADETGSQRVLKIHRLGRISFRTVKSNRDYLRKRQGGSWMYLSRLAAEKEYAFMCALREEGFPVPKPLSQSRHTVLMELIDAFPLRQVSQIPDPAALYAELISLILRLARHGLIHGDFNEFNILIKEESEKPEPSAKGKEVEKGPAEEQQEKEKSTVIPILIDFPQMVSMDHQNAEMYFDRDVNCVKRFFERRFHFVGTQPGPFFKDAKKTVGKDGAKRLDAAVEASGFSKKALKDLEAAIREQQATREQAGSGGEYDASSTSEDENEDEDEDENDDEDTEADESNTVGDDQGANASIIGLSKLSIGNET